MSHQTQWKRVALYGLIGAVAVSALLGIGTLVFGRLDETTAKILFSTLSVSFFGTTGLICAATWEKRQAPSLALPGALVAPVGLAIFLAGIWSPALHSVAFGKTMAIVAIFAFAFAHASALAFARQGKRLAWLFAATVAILLAVALLLSGMIVLEKDSEWLVRLTAALGIVSVAGSIALPVLGKLQSREKRGTAERIREIEIVCPRCGKQDTYPIGSIRCSECGLGLQVRVEAWEPAESETVLMS